MEIFVPVDGYNGRYLVSRQGHMKCRSRSGIGYSDMKGWTDKYGYQKVDLEGKNLLLHRVVAMQFIPNPDGKETVNHKNENKQDNRVENLEWMTNAENHNYGTRNERVGRALEKPLLRISKETGEVLQRYQCLKDAVNDGYNHSSVSRCANGKGLKSSGGFVWKWE